MGVYTYDVRVNEMVHGWVAGKLVDEMPLKEFDHDFVTKRRMFLSFEVFPAVLILLLLLVLRKLGCSDTNHFY